MVKFAAVLLGGMLGLACGAVLAADNYTMAFGATLTGTSIPSGRVGLGIPVDIDKKWDALPAAEQQAWREYTEMTDPDITPPFFATGIRGFLRKLDKLDPKVPLENIERTDRILLVVRISETGEVTAVELMDSPAAKNRTGVSDYEKILAARFSLALLQTEFVPARYKGQAAPSAFVMPITWQTSLR